MREKLQKSLARYTTDPAAFVGEAMKEPTARQAVEKLLMRAVDFFIAATCEYKTTSEIYRDISSRHVGTSH